MSPSSKSGGRKMGADPEFVSFSYLNAGMLTVSLNSLRKECTNSGVGCAMLWWTKFFKLKFWIVNPPYLIIATQWPGRKLRKNSGAAVKVLASFHTLLTGLIAFLYKSEKVSSHTWSPHCVTDFRKDLIFQGKALKSTSDKVKITKKRKTKNHYSKFYLRSFWNP